MPRLKRRAHLRYPAHKIVTYSYEDKESLTLAVDLGPDGTKILTHWHLLRGEFSEEKEKENAKKTIKGI